VFVWLYALYPNQLLPRARRRGASGGGQLMPRASRGVRSPSDLARRGEVATKTQKFRPISNCDTLPNRHVLLLARFGAPPTYVAVAWCGPIDMMLAREVGAPSNTTRGSFSMHLLVAAKAHHSRHIGVSKGELHIHI
jgi:hypothetical protein